EPQYNEMCVDDRICPSDLKCAICHSIYVSPVMLSCGHSFCSKCADGWLRKRHTCPTCRRDSSGHPIKNIVLGQIVEEHIRILNEDGPIPSDPLVSEDDEDIANCSNSSTPAETFVRSMEVRLSKRVRKTSSKYAETQRRLNSLGDAPPAPLVNSPAFVRSNTVRFASAIDRTPLHVAAARRRLEEGYVYTGLTPQESVSPVISRFERNRRGHTRTNHYSSPSRRSEQSAPLPESPGPMEIKRGGVIRRSLGLLRKSVRLLRKDSVKSQQEASIEEDKEEENDKTHGEDNAIGERQSFRRKSIRKSIIRRLRVWTNPKMAAAAREERVAATADEEEKPRLVQAARVLVIDSTANVELAAFLRSLGEISPDSLSHIRVLTSEERRDLPLLREEFEGLTLVSIVYTEAGSPNDLVVFDIYEGRREMSGEVEHCTLLLKSCHAVLLFCASDPSSALQATNDFRYVQRERKEMNLGVLPVWTVHAVQPVETPPRGRSGSTSSAGTAAHVKEGGRARSLSLAQANRLSTTELSTRLLPTKQKHLQLSIPPREEFIRAIQELLCELKSAAVGIS
ncbi:hypothetical protein PMAYCL1PPCAC_17572, partial [Pristionchus mayeri]